MFLAREKCRLEDQNFSDEERFGPEIHFRPLARCRRPAVSQLGIFDVGFGELEKEKQRGRYANLIARAIFLQSFAILTWEESIPQLPEATISPKKKTQ